MNRPDIEGALSWAENRLVSRAALGEAARTDVPDLARYAMALEEHIARYHETDSNAHLTPAFACGCSICTAVRARTEAKP